MEYFIIIQALLIPFMLILAYYENLAIIVQFITVWNEPIIGCIGIEFMIIEGILSIIFRIQLEKYDTPLVHIGEDHILITKGLNSYIRHPIYLGGILLYLGPFLAFRSLIMLILNIIL